MRVFLGFIRKYPKESILAPLLKLCEACFDLLVPLVIAFMIDRGVGERNPRFLWAGVGVLLAFALVGLGCAIVAQFFSARAAVGYAAQLRHSLYAHIQSFSYTDTDRVGTPALITRLTSDVNQIQTGVNMTLRLLLRSPIVVFGAVIMAWTIDTHLTVIFLCAIPLLAAIVVGVMLASVPVYRDVGQGLDGVTAQTREDLTGVRVIRAHLREADREAAFEKLNNAQYRLCKKAGLLSSVTGPGTLVLVNLSVVAIIGFGVGRFETGDVSGGDLVALVNYMTMILVELIKLANTTFSVSKAVAAGGRIDEVFKSGSAEPLHPETGVSDAEKDGEMADKSTAPDGEGIAVRFEHVSMRYADASADALTDITLTLKVGQTVGVVGGTGSGKTTLINMIPGYYPASRGRVIVMGNDVSRTPPQKLREFIGVVPQKAELFSGTVRSNLLWGCGDADDARLWQALDMARASEFVRLLPDGLDARVERDGSNFSGGQKQRLSLARTLLKQPGVLILDDSTSALDYINEAAIRHSLDGLSPKPTVIIVSQRVASVSDCDQIIVLDGGRLCGTGTHDELMASCEVYRELVTSQNRGGEPR